MDRRILDRYIKFNPATGKYEPDESRRYILPYHAYFSPSDQTGAYTLPGPPGLGRLVCWKQQYSSVNGMDANLGTPLQIKDLIIGESIGTAPVFTYDNLDALVELTELGESRKFMNQPIHMRTLFGTAKYPGRMCEPYMFASQHQIQARFITTGPSVQEFRPYLVGAQYFPWAAQSSESRNRLTAIIKKWNMRRSQVWPFWLTTDQQITLSANQEASFEMMPGQDAHFVACQLAAVSTGNFQYRLLEVKTQQSLSNGAATFTNSLGDARLPRIFSKPYVVPAGYRMRLLVRDLSGASNTIWFTIAGKKVFAPLARVEAEACDTRALDVEQES